MGYVPATVECPNSVLAVNRMATDSDHLFVSHPNEDGLFVDWLHRKLASEGYEIWCDKLELLGGECNPTDTDQAIKECIYRLIQPVYHAIE